MNDTCPLHPFSPYNKTRVKAPVTNPHGNAENLVKVRAAKKEQATEGLDEYDKIVGQKK